ncbi:benenodin family lasso peptide [Sphingobium sp. YR657]|uniref:benenodin family lasso peptide n=1 Tax=Sphingobium sp. YR657 TaxID=1884366 RepID=UPI0015875CE6|nr:benenodin family lasso peptide [Sphingobium sp. YR657]
MRDPLSTTLQYNPDILRLYASVQFASSLILGVLHPAARRSIMEREQNDDVVELGAVSTETKGGQVGINDLENGLQLGGGGLTDD